MALASSVLLKQVAELCHNSTGIGQGDIARSHDVSCSLDLDSRSHTAPVWAWMARCFLQGKLRRISLAKQKKPLASRHKTRNPPSLHNSPLRLKQRPSWFDGEVEGQAESATPPRDCSAAPTSPNTRAWQANERRAPNSRFWWQQTLRLDSGNGSRIVFHQRASRGDRAAQAGLSEPHNLPRKWGPAVEGLTQDAPMFFSLPWASLGRPVAVGRRHSCCI